MTSPGGFNVVPVCARMTLGAGATHYFDFGATPGNWPNKVILSFDADTDLMVLPSDATTAIDAIPAAPDANVTAFVPGFLRPMKTGVPFPFSIEAKSELGNARDGRKRYWHVRSSSAGICKCEAAIAF